MKQNPQYIDIDIDKLTKSIENVITGRYSSRSGGFNGALGRLRTLRLIEGTGHFIVLSREVVG